MTTTPVIVRFRGIDMHILVIWAKGEIQQMAIMGFN